MGVVQALSPIAAQLFGGKAARKNRRGDAPDRLACARLAVLGVLLLAFPEAFLRLASAPRRSRRHSGPTFRASPGAAAMLLFAFFLRSPPRVPASRGLAINSSISPPRFRSTRCFIYGRWARRARRSGLCGRNRDRELAESSRSLDLLRKAPVLTRPFRIFGGGPGPTWPTLWSHLKLGVPIGLAFFVEVTSFTFIALFLARLARLLPRPPDLPPT